MGVELSIVPLQLVYPFMFYQKKELNLYRIIPFYFIYNCSIFFKQMNILDIVGNRYLNRYLRSKNAILFYFFGI